MVDHPFAQVRVRVRVRVRARHHMVDHPFAQRVMRALEHTLLPDEAMLQTIAVNSPFRRAPAPELDEPSACARSGTELGDPIVSDADLRPRAQLLAWTSPPATGACTRRWAQRLASPSSTTPRGMGSS